MKKVFLLLLTFALLLSACGGQPAATPEPALEDRDPGCAALTRSIVLGQERGKGYGPLSEEDIKFYVNQVYRLPHAPTEGSIYTVGSTDPREVALFRFPGEVEAQEGAAALETYRRNRAGDFYGYDPQAAALVEGGKVLRAGEWAALLICQEPEKAEDSFREAMDWVEVSLPQPPPDYSGYPPFDPPQDFDMTLCDLTPLTQAWHSGDWSGLDEKQEAVLTLCREVFAQRIRPGMTQVERELVLHDWLIDLTEYDRTHYDPRTPQGREDNNNPYGALVKGYAVCLGYAETFRLLMELCGVECATVVGAAYSSTEDHAWNLVKLEGEWYCVDPTWDDANWEEPGKPRSWVRHQYFNVTSDLMRSTDHQWDYASTPECTAARFRWEGTGPLPE